jgi:serpin B
MRQTGSFGYQETDTFQAIQLRYKAELRDGLTLSIFLPKAPSNLKEFVGSLTPQHWKALLQNFKQQEGSLFLPRFRIECSLDGLREALSRLGLNRCFAREADFKGMLQEDVPFWIGDVLQKTYIDVNERGTEAAAVTSTMGFMMAFSKPTERFQIKVDHPFFVSLSDQKTGALLFTASVWEV